MYVPTATPNGTSQLTGETQTCGHPQSRAETEQDTHSLDMDTKETSGHGLRLERPEAVNVCFSKLQESRNRNGSFLFSAKASKGTVLLLMLICSFTVMSVVHMHL